MKKRITIPVLLFTLLLSCTLGEPDRSSSFDILDMEVMDPLSLYSRVDESTRTLDVSLYSLDDGRLVSLLNRKAAQGVKIRVLVDISQTNTLTDLNTSIQVSAGNKNGRMEANFILSDSNRIQVLSSARLSNKQVMVLTLYDLEMMKDFFVEFEQMYSISNFGIGNDTEFAKIPLNFNQSYHINGNLIEIYFLPQDAPLSRLMNRAAQSQSSALMSLNKLGHSQVYTYWDLMIQGGIAPELVLYAQALQEEPLLYNFLSGNVTLYGQALPANTGFFDLGTQIQTFAMTSFDLEQVAVLNQSDGVLIMVHGPEAALFYTKYQEALQSLTSTNVAASNVRILNNVGYTNLIFSEIGFVRIDNDWFSEFFEIKNRSTSHIDLSGYTVVITNINRLSEPSTLTLPYGAVLAPGEHFVVGGDSKALAHVDLIWSDIFVMTSGFSLNLISPDGTRVDYAGNVNMSFSDMNGTVSASTADISITRNEPATDGDVGVSWSATSGTTNINSSYIGEVTATPGSD